MKHRLVGLCAASVVAIGLAAGGFAVAQDSSTQVADGAATPDSALCATPVSEAVGTPVSTVMPADTAATPGGVDEGTPVGLFLCATPGDASPGMESGADATGGATAAAPITVAMTDIYFEQPEITIPADTDVTFVFVNNGFAAHNFMIDSPEIFSGDLNSGATTEVVVNLPAGTYPFYCSVVGHKEAGMVGTLTVQ